MEEGKLECMLKTFVEGLKDRDDKYKKCYECEGTNETKECYAKPNEDYNHGNNNM